MAILFNCWIEPEPSAGAAGSHFGRGYEPTDWDVGRQWYFAGDVAVSRFNTFFELVAEKIDQGSGACG